MISFDSAYLESTIYGVFKKFAYLHLPLLKGTAHIVKEK